MISHQCILHSWLGASYASCRYGRSSPYQPIPNPVVYEDLQATCALWWYQAYSAQQIRHNSALEQFLRQTGVPELESS